MRYKVTREIIVEAETHGRALDLADDIWADGDIDQLVAGESRATVEKWRPR